MTLTGRRRLPLIYIAGPFRGPTPLDVRRNVEAARDAGMFVARQGGYPVIPHTMTADFDKQLDDQFWLDGTMEMLRRCDAVVLMHTWERSTGAKAEREEALRLNLPVFHLADIGDGGTLFKAWLYAWQENRRVMGTIEETRAATIPVEIYGTRVDQL